MKKISESIFKYTPIVVWTLTLSMGQTLLTYAILSSIMGTDELLIVECYIRPLFIIIPLLIFKEAGNRVKYLWEYILILAAVIILLYITVNSAVLIALTVIIGALRFLQRINKGNCILDEVHGSILIPFAFYYIFSVVQFYELLQKLILCYILIILMLLFTYFGLKRSEYYIMLRKDKANVPDNQVISFGVKNYGIISIAVVLFMMPIILTQYEPIEFSFESNDYVYEEYLEEMEVSENQENLDLREIFGENDTNEFLEFIANILSIMLFIVFYLVVAIGIVVTIYRMIKAFHIIPEEQCGDLIESIVNIEEIMDLKKKKKIVDLFDFSEEMKIRRRYKKELKKYNPKKWQTPSEMERMANLEIPELHAQYEKARYGNKCKKETE